MGTYGDLWGPLQIFWYQWGPIRTKGDLWGPMGRLEWPGFRFRGGGGVDRALRPDPPLPPKGLN